MAIVGSAHVVIRALTDKLQSDIQAGLNKAAAGASSSGGDAGRAFSDSFNSHFDLGDGNSGFNRVENTARRTGQRAGRQMGREIADEMGDGAERGGNAIVRAASNAGGRAGNVFGKMFNGNSGGGSRIFVSMALRIAALIPLLGALVGGISSVVSGLFAMGAAAGNAIYALAPLPGLVSAIAQGGAVIMTAFGGVGTALSAGLKDAPPAAAATAKALDGLKNAARDAAEAVRDAAEAVRDAREEVSDAAEGIRDARENLRDTVKALADTEKAAAREIVDATKAVEEAKKNLHQAAEDGAEAEEQAAERVADAEDALVNAHKRVQKAQEALTDARKAAQEQLIDLEFASRGGAIAEQRAIMAIQDARYKLNATSELPPDNRLRQEAQLAFDEAQLNYEMINEHNGDTAESLEEIKEKGIEGTDAVVNAQENLIDAQKDVADAADNVTESLENQRKVHEDVVESIKEGNKALKETKQALKDAYADAPEMIRDAQEAVRDAKEALRDSKEALSDAQESLRDALRALADAKKGSSDANNEFAAGVPVVNAYQDALDKLSPPARKFVEFLISIRDEMATLRTAAAAGLFPGLQTAIENLVYGPLFPAVRQMMYDTGVAVGNAAISISNSLNSGPFVASFGNVTAQNATTIERMGLVVGDLTAALFAFMDAARPVTDELTRWIVSWADGVRVQTEAGNASGELTNKLVAGADQMKQLIRILGNLWEGIYDIGVVAAPAGQSLLDSFEKATEKFANFTDNKKNVRELADQFDVIADNLRHISDLALTVGGVFFRLGADPTIGKLAKQLDPVVKTLEGLITTLLDDIGDDLVLLVDQILVAFEEISKSGGINIFLQTMSTAIGVLITAFQNPIFGPILRTLVQIGAAMYAISILTKFPGLGFLTKTLGHLATFIFPLLARGISAAFIAMGPIGWAVLGVAALVAAFVLAYKKIEWFREGVDYFVDQFMKGADQIDAGIRYFIDQIVKGAQQIWDFFTLVVDAATWLFDVLFGHSIFPDIQKGFEDFFSAVGGIFTSIATFFTETIPNAASTLFNWLKNNWPLILGILTGPIGLAVLAIVTHWDAIKAKFIGVKDWAINTFSNAWNNVKDKLVDPIVAAKDRLQELFGEGGPIRGFFVGIKDWAVDKFSSAWGLVKDKIIDPIAAGKDRIGEIFGEGGPVRNFFNGIVTWAGDVFKRAWDGLEGIIKAPINLAKEGIQTIFGEEGPVRTAFKNAVAAIGTIWDGLKRLLATPVNFMINTVYNEGLRKAMNLLPGVTLAEATPIAFAEGGVLPGYTPGRDVHEFVSPTAGRLSLSGGEAIMRPEFTKAVGGEAGVNRLNSMARRGLKFASGGVFRPTIGGTFGPWHEINASDIGISPGTPVASVMDGRVSASYDIAGPLPTDKYHDPAYGPFGSYGRVIKVDHGSGRASLYAHLSERLASAGQMVAAGTVIGLSGSAGNSSGPHLHFDTTGMSPFAFEYGSTNYGGNAGPGQGPSGPATNPGEKEKQDWLDIIKQLPSRIKNVYDDVQSMGGKGGYYPMIGQAGRGVGHDAVQWMNDKIPDKIVVPNFPDIPLPHNPIPNPFDRGGIAEGEENVWLPKKTAKPERVLDPAQTAAFERLVTYLEKNGLGGSGGGGNISLSVQVPQDASARDVVEGITYEMRRLNRGGRYNN